MRLGRSILPLLVLLATPAAASAATRSVAVPDFEFAPATVEVELGDTVVWSFQGPTEHTTTSRSGQADRWSSALSPAGSSYERTFTTPGRFQYFCRPHPYMRGTIQVGDDEIPASVKRPRTRRSGRRAKTTFRVLEPVEATAVLKGPTRRRIVKRRLTPGAGAISWGRLRPGEYRGVITFVDDFDKDYVIKNFFVVD